MNEICESAGQYFQCQASRRNLSNLHFHRHESIDVLHEIICFYQFLFLRFEVILLCFSHVEVNFATFYLEGLS